MLHFCTYFDQHYLVRGLALHASLQQHCASFNLHVLCLDALSEKILRELQLPDLQVISAGDFFTSDAELNALRSTRDAVSLYFTCTPILPRYLFDRLDVPHMIYLDADLYFFSDPSRVIADVADASAAIIPNRFPANRDRANEHGIYNVGLIYFDRSEESAQILARWRAQCIAYCSDSTARGQYGDQKYLDDWPQQFRRVRVIDHAGCNLAPWNFARHSMRLQGNAVLADELAVVFVHFHGFNRVWRRLFVTVLKNFDVRPNQAILTLYRRYARAIEHAEQACAAWADVRISERKGLRKQVDNTQGPLQRVRIWLAQQRSFLSNIWHGRCHWL
jgi:lipopolysaccharide biosynthesis glycosyltransferase